MTRDERPKAGLKGSAANGPRARSVDDLTARNVRSIERLEELEQRRCGPLDRIANRISAFAGSTSFLILHLLWFGGWIAYNGWPGTEAFDPFPFTFLTLVVSLEAIFLSAFILISQMREARVSDHRNRLDLQINLLTEQENTKMLMLLESIARKVGVDQHDASLEALKQPTRLEKLSQQIEEAEQKARAAS